MRLATPIIALAALALTIPATATAMEPTQVTITDFQATSIVVTSGRCVDIPMSFKYATTDPTIVEPGWVDADIDLWNGDENTGTVDFGDETNSGTMTGEYTWCAIFDGLGTFNLTNLTGEVDGYNANNDLIERSFTAPEVQATFTVQTGSRITSAKVTKKGKKRTFTAAASYFDVGNTNAWRKFPKGGRITLQRDDAGTWTNLKTAKTDKKGKVKFTYSAKARASYRLVYSGSTTVAGSTSATLTK